MKCLKCHKKAHYNGLCRKHFMEQIEARVRKEIRAKELIKKNDVLVVKDPIAKFLIKKIMGGMPLRIVKSGKGRFVELWTLDDEVLCFLTEFFGESKQKKVQKDSIRPFRTVKDDELLAFAKLSGVKFKKKKRTKREEEMKKALQKIEKKHPETKFSLLRSVEGMRNLK